MRLFSVNTGLFKLDGGAMFGTIPKSLWSRSCPADELNLCTLAMRCLLVKEQDRLILIDTGIGHKQTDKFFSYYYLHGEETLEQSLSQHGFHTDDITDVILTHLHLDHVGGALKMDGDKIAPTFKNASYWSNDAHWKWATEPNDRERPSFLTENIVPLAELKKLHFISFEYNEAIFSDSIKLRLVHGHTESMMLPLINFDGRTLAYVADLFPTAAHVPVNYVAAYDIAPLTAMNEKELFLREALANNYTLFFEHDPVVECATLTETAKGVRIDKTMDLEQFLTLSI